MKELAAAEAQRKAMEQARCEECKKQARTEAEEEKAANEAAEAKRKADTELAAAEAQKKTMEQVDRGRAGCTRSFARAV